MVLLPLGALAAHLGLTYAVVTAPVIGANIGGALMLFGALPFTGVMVAVAVAAMANLRKVSALPDVEPGPWPHPPPA